MHLLLYIEHISNKKLLVLIRIIQRSYLPPDRISHFVNLCAAAYPDAVQLQTQSAAATKCIANLESRLSWGLPCTGVLHDDCQRRANAFVVYEQNCIEG